MAPSAVQQQQTEEASVADLANLKLKASSFKEPLKSTGSLDKYTSIDITPVIGTEYPQVNLVELVNAPNADELLRDLAIKSMSSFFPLTFSDLYHSPSSLTSITYLTSLTNTPSIPTRRCLLPLPIRPNQRPPKSANPASRRPRGQARRLRPAHPPSAKLRP